MTPESTDLAAQENAAPFTTTVFGWWRKDLPLEVSYRYWRDVHGVLFARVPGLYQYRQLHLAPSRSDVGPLEGIDTLPPADPPHGIVQILFLTDEDCQACGTSPLVTEHIDRDEQNFLDRKATASSEGSARTYVDRTGEAAPNGEPAFPSFAVCFRQATSTPVEEFRRHLVEQVARPWSEQDAVLRLRLHLINRYEDASPAEQNLPSEKQYQAWIELVLRQDSLRQLFSSGGLSEHAQFIQAVHTFAVSACYTLVSNGRPTVVGLRGFPAVKTIEQVEADNQKATELLELLYGEVVHGFSTQPESLCK